MQLFLDTADEAQVKYWAGHGVIDGVTTNPSVLLRAGVIDVEESLVNLASLIAPGVLHAEVTVESGRALVREAVHLAGLAENVAVKVPILTPDGEPCLGEIRELARSGITVNTTACLTFGQAVLAAKAGAKYLSILVGRVDDEGGDGAAVIRDCRTWLDDWQVDAKIIAASVRGPADVRRSMAAGAHCVTVPPAVLAKLADHRYSRHTVREFLDDARTTARTA